MLPDYLFDIHSIKNTLQRVLRKHTQSASADWSSIHSCHTSTVLCIQEKALLLIICEEGCSQGFCSCDAWIVRPQETSDPATNTKSNGQCMTVSVDASVVTCKQEQQIQARATNDHIATKFAPPCLAEDTVHNGVEECTHTDTLMGWATHVLQWQ